MATDVFNPAVQEALTEAYVDQIRSQGNTAFRPFNPGDSEVGELVGEGGTFAFSSTATDRVIIYDTLTWEPREILVNMLAKTLKKQRNGKPAFTYIQPGAAVPGKYVTGQAKCWLHPEHERRAMFDQIGLQAIVCLSGHLASEFDATQHMQHRHRREYGVIKEHLDRIEREEERTFQREMLQQIKGGAVATRKTFDCGDCDRFFDSAQGLTLHRNKEHGNAAS